MEICKRILLQKYMYIVIYLRQTCLTPKSSIVKIKRLEKINSAKC